MKKIPTMFLRGDDRKVIDESHPDCAWVFAGEGIATEKLDGTNVRLTIRAGQGVRVEKRRNPTREQKALGIIDPWYVDVQGGGDPTVAHPADRWIVAAIVGTDVTAWPNGEHCCEAVGPKIQGNPLGLEEHVCVPFNLWASVLCRLDVPRDFEGLRTYLAQSTTLYSAAHLPIEGIVFHHPDGRRAKIKRKDF